MTISGDGVERQTASGVIWTVGRAIVGGFFVLAGVSKLLDREAPLAMMAEQGMPGWLLPLVIALEIGGGLVVALGRPTRWLAPVALALAAFTLATNLAFHRFWEFDGLMHRLEISLFFKNIAIMGALFLLAGRGSRA